MVRYLIYILQIILVCILIVGFFSISKINDEINSKISKINREKIEFEEVKKKLFTLQKNVKDFYVKPIDKQKAMDILLTKANYFLINNNAKLSGDIEDNNQILSLKMSIDTPVKTKRQLRQLLKDLTSSKYPLIDVEKFEIKSSENKTFLKVVFKLIQVYKG